MPIFLRRNIVNFLVDELHGGYDELASTWEEHAFKHKGTPKAPSRSTLYRWVADGVPTLLDGSDHRFFTLCGLLDVDPLAILDFQKHGYFSKFARLRQLVYYGRKSLGGIATLLDMYRPADVWPSETIAKDCFGHGWRAHHLTNGEDWKNSSYILLKPRFSGWKEQHPRAVHIAYRRIGVPDTMWRYYGTVLAIDHRIELYSESGTFQVAAQVDEGEVPFRTYFGGRPVEWRIASLHQFSMPTPLPSNDNSAVTFTW